MSKRNGLAIITATLNLCFMCILISSCSLFKLNNEISNANVSANQNQLLPKLILPNSLKQEDFYSIPKIHQPADIKPVDILPPNIQ